MIDPQEVEAIIDIVEARYHQHEEAKANKPQRRHWPRRVVLSVGILGVAVVTHKLIEHQGAAYFLQSAELGLAALFDCIFTKVKE